MSSWSSKSRATHDSDEAEQSSESKTTDAPAATNKLMDLQQSAGNKAVQRLVDGLSGTSADATNESMPADVRRKMEEGFGQDFSDVRIHTDADSAAKVVERDNSAYTVGRDIYFAPGKYDPKSPEGTQLLSHELAHVSQQKMGSEGESGSSQSNPEAEADHAAKSVSAGRPLDVALSPVKSAAPMGAPADWSKDVTDAKSKKDADAMAALIETAIASTKRKVVAAKTSSGGTIDPKDYKPLPTINFDINLNTKDSKPLTTGGTTRSLGPNYGYWFSDGSNLYIVLGPKALDPDSPTFTMMYLEHELYHIGHHAPKAPTSAPSKTPATGPTSKPAVRTTDEEELETWTQDFINYFHQLRSFRPGWIPLIDYYEKSSATEQAAALARLTAYYKTPPVGAADVDSVKKSFEAWVRRRLKDSATASMKLIVDLSKALSITLSSPSSAPSTAPSSTPAPPP